MTGKPKDPDKTYSPNWGGPRGGGPTPKAEKGERKYRKAHITLPPDLYDQVIARRRKGEPLSHTFARILRAGLKIRST